MKPRNAWTDSDYAAATGRTSDIIKALRSRVAQGMNQDEARQAAAAQGINPDLICKPAPVEPAAPAAQV